MLWPGMATGVPSALNLPMRRSDHHGSGEGREAAHRVDHRGAGEVHRAVTETELGAERGEPAAAPDPHAVDRVDDRAHEHAERHERRELPALGHRAGDDGGGGVHEHELEQEEREYAGIVGAVSQRADEEALGARDCLSRNLDSVPVEDRLSTRRPEERAHGSELEREPDEPVGERADREDHEVRHGDVCGVLASAEARLHEHEARLHEEDQTHAHGDEEDVQPDLDVAQVAGCFRERRRSRLLRGHGSHAAVVAADRVRVGERGHDHEGDDREDQGPRRRPLYDERPLAAHGLEVEHLAEKRLHGSTSLCDPARLWQGRFRNGAPYVFGRRARDALVSSRVGWPTRVRRLEGACFAAVSRRARVREVWVTRETASEGVSGEARLRSARRRLEQLGHRLQRGSRSKRRRLNLLDITLEEPSAAVEHAFVAEPPQAHHIECQQVRA